MSAKTMGDNFNKNNIAKVRASINDDTKRKGKQSYTMVQVNSPCDVKVSKESYKIGAKLILK